VNERHRRAFVDDQMRGAAREHRRQPQPIQPVARSQQQRRGDRAERAGPDQPDERELRRAGEHQR
jgi:hypothetical protein